MKRFILVTALYPASVILEFVFGKLAERFDAALYDLDYELSDDE